MYEITLEALRSANNERLWFTTNIKLARIYLDTQRLNDVERILHLLKQSCQLPDGSDDLNKGTYLLEIYCLDIQLCSLTNNAARMKLIYPKTLNLNAAVADPRIMGVIREEGGKMYMSQGQWTEAYNELYESFRAYQEAGNPRAKSCLKYVVLASMLSLSNINPFAAREAKVFAEDPEIIAMSDLRQSLEANDLKRFERILKNKNNKILDEPFLMKYIHPLRRRMREQVIL
jgi:COP9 signalosome complex subunit 2